ncbi:MAG TPA: extracellular solute-binding protein [Acetobacteraceae bacterium]|nr:extracellular solute-binding protein [Acetobacteraceae bacterium]
MKTAVACALLLVLIGAPMRGQADETVKTSHAVAVLGTPALPPDFPYFPYVNPDAPKGGDVTLGAIGSFDSFNPFILRGTAAAAMVDPWVILPGGAQAGSTVGHVFESLLEPSADEIATAYCHICTTVEIPTDRRWVAFNLRPQARFSDGVPVTAADVAWTFRTLLAQGRPSFRIQMADVSDVTVESPTRVVFHLKPNENRALPLILGGLPVLPEHWFKGRNFAEPLREPPVGSGPYRITGFALGRSVTYQRDPNWWARDLPTGRGMNNFDTVHIEYYRESSIAMEAFKAGQIDLRSENIAKRWATGYDFPAVRQGLVIKANIRHHLPTGMEGWAMNTRRPVFSNPLVRQALSVAYDFEWANKNLFYNDYTRTLSYFSNSDLASSGLPGPEELKLLEPFRKELPPALFEQPFTLPVTDGSGNDRKELMQALKLLQQAGWQVKNMKLVDASGQQMRFTILLPDPSFERVALPYAQTLKHLGIEVQVRTVDPAQYQHLTDNFDYDMTLMVYPESDIPGMELRDYFSCASAKAEGSMNLPGACDPAVDTLINDVIAAADRPHLQTAARALDRVLLWRWYLVPGWGSQSFHIAYWDRFGHPEKPIREGVDFDTWWVDAGKVAHTDATRKSGG